MSALHVLTERLVGATMDSVQTGSPYHTEYRCVSEAVRTLEEAGLVTVRRSAGTTSYVGNPVEAIALRD